MLILGVPIDNTRKTSGASCRVSSLLSYGNQQNECCWWPGRSKQLEAVVKSCHPCLMTRGSPVKQELQTWEWPKKPWSRVHIDFFGPFMNRWCLVIVDSYSKWIECFDMGRNTTSKATINILKSVFARFGLPNTLVSDNGTAFVSDEFKNFLKINNIFHSTTPVGHPATNGLAENAVRTLKNALKRGVNLNKADSFSDVLYKFLLDYRNTPHCSTSVSPAQLMFGRQLRTRLDVLNPFRKVERKPVKLIKENVMKQQMNQKKNYNGCKQNNFKENDVVMAKNFATPGRITWTKAVVTKKLGKQTFLVRVEETGKIWKRHANQMITCESKSMFEKKPPAIFSNTLDKLMVAESFRENTNKLAECPSNSPNIGGEEIASKSKTNVEDCKENINQNTHGYNLRARKQCV